MLRTMSLASFIDCAVRWNEPVWRWTMSRSAPAEKAFTAPVITATLVSGSAPTSSHTRLRS